MKVDPFIALEAHFASQDQQVSAEFRNRVSALLEDEVRPVDFMPVVSSVRRVIPVAAMTLLGILTPNISPRDVESLSNEIEQLRASSVQTELETPWEN